MPEEELSSVVNDFSSFRDYEEAARETLEFLHNRYSFGLWMITRTVENDWIVLQSRDSAYEVVDGEVFKWSDSFCYQMVRKNGPNVAPASDEVEAYANAAIGKKVPIKAYIGYPLKRTDGSLFGTLCAIDPHPQSDMLHEDEPLFRLLSQLLSFALDREAKSLELSQSIELLEDKVYHDPLTGVLNRRAWDSLVEKQEKKCQLLGEAAAVIILDLDGLKRINDTQGHQKGDSYIIGAAEAIVKATRADDAAARLGGDEFGILLESDIALNPAPLLERLHSNFAAANISASIGWAKRDPRRDLKSAIKRADEMMYEDKRRRKAHRE